MVTDEALMRAVKDGDVARLGALFERHHAALFDFLCRLTGDPAVAEDLVQDVFVRMLRYRATYRDDGRFEPWMFRIARNARADHFRKKTPESRLPEGTDWVADAPGPAGLLERGRELKRLRHALTLLREDRRELVLLARYRGLSHEEIGALLGVEAGTVKVRFHRAMKELREIFTKLGEGKPNHAL